MSKTLLEMRNHVKADLDLDEETFIEDSDINRWINEGIEEAESQIHTLYEDYFLDESIINITAGQNKVDYPADIYANKVRRIIYSDSNLNSNSSHTVRRVKDLTKAKELDLFADDTTNPILHWAPSNDATEGRKIRLFPQQGRAGVLNIFYIRNAKRLSLDADVLDIDEFSRYIIQYAKTQAYLKDGDPRADDSKVLEEQFKLSMIETLSNMAPDDDDFIEPDVSHYDEMLGDEEWS